MLSFPHSLQSNKLGMMGRGFVGGFHKASSVYDISGFSVFASCLPECRSLTSLKCAFAAPTACSCQRLLTFLSSRLLTLARSLSSNGVGCDGGAALAEGLKGNSMLQSLE